MNNKPTLSGTRVIFYILLALIISFLSLSWALRGPFTVNNEIVSNQSLYQKAFGASSESLAAGRLKHFKKNNFDKDGWLNQGASFEVSFLNSRGNKAIFHWSDWFPEGHNPPNIDVKVCGKLSASFRPEIGGKNKVYLKGNCNPRLVEITSPTPLILNPEDNRELLAKLDKIEISSKFKLPIVHPIEIVKLGSVIFIFLILIHFLRISALQKTLFSLGLILLSSLLIKTFYYHTESPLMAFYLMLFIILLSLIICQYFNERAENFYEIKFYSFLNSSYFFYFSLLATFVAGAFLRFYEVDFGLPARYHADESSKFNAVERMRENGDLSPKYFLHPTLMLYAAYFFNTVIRFFNEFNNSWLDTFIYSGRVMSAFAGSLSILLVAIIGKRLFNPFVGFCSGALLAFFPLHITCSRYLKEDALLTFFVLLAVYFLVLGIQSKGKAATVFLILSGFACGLSASTKYSGLITLTILFAIPFLKNNSFKPDPKYFPVTFLAILAMPIGFILASPYVILDFETFWFDFNRERLHMIIGHDTIIDPWSQLWTYHFSRSFVTATYYLPFVIGIMGLVYLCFKRTVVGFFILGIFFLYFIPAEYVNAKPAPQPDRYIVPCLPFIAIAAAVFMNFLFKLARSTKQLALVLLLLACLICLPAFRSIHLAKDLNPDTRAKMQSWIENNLPKGSKVLIEIPNYQITTSHHYQLELIKVTRQNVMTAMQPEELRKYDADYLVLTSFFYSRYFDQPNMPNSMKNLFAKLLKAFPMIKEVKASSGSYGFHNPTLRLYDLRGKKELE